MPSEARGWFAPDGKPRYETLKTLGLRNGETLYRARDRMSQREVLLVVGGESLLARANLSGRLEHPATVTVYDVGRDPEGRVFLAAMDHTVARPLSELLGEMTRDEVLRVVVTAAHAAAHAEERGVLNPCLDLDQVLLFPDGHFRVIGWDEPAERQVIGWDELAERHDPAARSVQKLLRRAIVPYGKAPRPLWSIVRHEYTDAGKLARDLSAYLDGASSLEATRLPWRRRLGGWASHHAVLATFTFGTAGVLVLSGVLAAGLYYLHTKEEAQRKAIEIEAAREEIDRAIASAREALPEVLELDKKRLALLAEREEIYHDTPQRRPTDDERGRDSELADLTRERAGLAQTVEVALKAAGEDPRGIKIRYDLEKGRLRWLFAYAGYEERKTLSTRTLERARQTRPIGEALLEGDPDSARMALADLDRDHPFRLAVEALLGAVEVHPPWVHKFAPLAAELLGDGQIALDGFPHGATASLAPIEQGAEGRWRVGESVEIAPGEIFTRPMGDYLVVVKRGGHEFRFEVLLERREDETIDLQDLPDAVPEGFVWIPAATLYIGGDGKNATRYRRTRVEKPFAIERTEVPLRDAGVQVEGYQPEWPLVSVAQGWALEFCRANPPVGWRGDLPTEEEWELAARGVAGRDFPWGDEYRGEYANTIDYRKEPSRERVGFPETDSSLYAVLGMAGNVFEWTSSEFGKGLATIKGGYFFDGEAMARASSRGPAPREEQMNTCGFRRVLRQERP